MTPLWTWIFSKKNVISCTVLTDWFLCRNLTYHLSWWLNHLIDQPKCINIGLVAKNLTWMSWRHFTKPLLSQEVQRPKTILSNAYEQGNECYSFPINLWVKSLVIHSILHSEKLFVVIILQIAYSIDILMS